MNEIVLTDVTRNLLGAWYLDLKFLVDLLEEYNIEFDDVMESIECNFWKDVKLEINLIIYEVLSTIAYKFISENSELFEIENDEFEIYTNYIEEYFNNDAYYDIWWISKKNKILVNSQEAPIYPIPTACPSQYSILGIYSNIVSI